MNQILNIAEMSDYGKKKQPKNNSAIWPSTQQGGGFSFRLNSLSEFQKKPGRVTETKKDRGGTWKRSEWWKKERRVMYTGSKWMTTAEMICLTAIPNISFPNKTLPQHRMQTEKSLLHAFNAGKKGQALESGKKTYF